MLANTGRVDLVGPAGTVALLSSGTVHTVCASGACHHATMPPWLKLMVTPPSVHPGVIINLSQSPISQSPIDLNISRPRATAVIFRTSIARVELER